MILIDSDVIIDFAIQRQPHFHNASEFLRRVERGVELAFVSWHTIANVYYVVRPFLGRDNTRDFIGDLIRVVEVAPTNTDDIRYAVQLPMNDFEDAMQVAAARAYGARTIITRNLGDYRNSPIPAISPQQFLTTLN